MIVNVFGRVFFGRPRTRESGGRFGAMTAAVLLASALVIPLQAHAQDFQTAVVAMKPLGSTAIVGGTVVPYKEVTLSAQVPGEIRFIAVQV